MRLSARVRDRTLADMFATVVLLVPAGLCPPAVAVCAGLDS
jgi:hypothetical protein